MVFKLFSIQLALRLGVLFVLLVTLSYLITATDAIAGPSVLAIITILVSIDIVRLVGRTNKELARFTAALDNRDFAQRHDLAPLGASFKALADSFESHLARARGDRAEQERSSRYLRSLLEQSPVPLMTVEASGSCRLINHAARRLFNRSELANIADIREHCPDLPEILTELKPGERRVVDFFHGTQTLKFSVTLSQLSLDATVIRLVSLQNIQREMEGAELEAWQRLVRVLTHEIMNSITPISSLSRTAADLLADERPDIDDVREAVETVARRSEGLTQFVQSYNALARLPEPSLKRIALNDVFADIARLVGTELEQQSCALSVRVEPAHLEVSADPDQLEQILINLVRNAAEAMVACTDCQIELSARAQGERDVVISVSDSGPGIPKDVRDKVFIPFFTTKRTGSGIGLALTRQIMLAHGGSVALADNDPSGTRILLSFPQRRPASLLETQ